MLSGIRFNAATSSGLPPFSAISSRTLSQPPRDSFVRFSSSIDDPAADNPQENLSLEGIVRNIFTLVHDHPRRRGFLESLFDPAEAHVTHVQDDEGRLTVMRDNQNTHRDDSDRYHYWFDFDNTESPALQALVNDVLPARHNAFSRALTPSLKNPTVKGRILEITAHAVDFSDDGKEFTIQPIRFYLNQNYLITAHNGQNDSMDRALEVLEEVPLEDKVPTRLMNFVLHDISQQYAKAIASLDSKRKNLANNFRANENMPKFVEELNLIADKTDELDEALTSQQTLIESLLEMSSLTRAGSLVEKDLRQRQREIESRMQQIDKLQRAENRLADAYKIRLNERTQRSMSRIAAAQLVSLPILITAGLMGMNVPLPFEGEPWNFFLYAGGSGSMSAALWAWIKYKKWL